MSHIARWGNLVGIANAADYGDLVGLFQFFRPDGDGAEAVFDGYAFGQEILSRVRRCYDATRGGFRSSDASSFRGLFSRARRHRHAFSSNGICWR